MKKKINLLKLTFIIFIMFLFIGCALPSGEDNSSTSLKQGGIAKIDIVDAKSLFISKSSDNGARTLYKIEQGDTSNDQIVTQVTYEDNDGNLVPYTLIPEKILDVNDSWLILVYYDYNNYPPCVSAFLVNKLNGSTFSLNEIGVPSSWGDNFKNENGIFLDGSGNIYYLSYLNNGSAVIKIDMSDPNNPTGSKYSPSYYDDIYDFAVGSNGNLFFEYDFADEEYFKIKKADNNTLYNVKIDENFYMKGFFIGLDGSIIWYYCDWWNDKIVIREVDVYGASPNFTTNDVSFDTQNYYDYEWNAYIFKFDTKIILFDMEIESLLEIDNDITANIGTETSLTEIDDITITGANNNYIFVAGTKGSDNKFLVVDPDTYGETIVDLPASYEIVRLSVAKDENRADFIAINLANSYTIVGQIYENGTNNWTYTINSDFFDEEVIELQRIN